jgi:hypothetical protein
MKVLVTGAAGFGFGRSRPRRSLNPLRGLAFAETGGRIKAR